MDESALRQLLIDTARQSVRRGLNRGTSGNLSVRLPGGFLITPTGIPYEDLSAADLVHWGGRGGGGRGEGKRSAGWRVQCDR